MKIFFPISLILISIILFFLVVNPLYNNIQLLSKDVSIYNKALDNSTILQRERDSLLEKYRNISQKDKYRLNNFLPDSVNNIKFILEIEQIANLHGMPLKDIKFEDKKQEKVVSSGNNMIVSNNNLNSHAYGVFPVEFITEGKYNSFVLFLKDLEHNLRVMDIKSISFIVPKPVAKLANGVDPNIYSYKLNVDTYWLK